MRQLTFLPERRLEWREVPEPRLGGDGEALVRPLAVATCDLDLLLVTGRMPVDTAFAFGHECVAEVIAVGDAVTSVRPGDRVAVPFQISCGTCGCCRRGHTGNCERVEHLAMFGLPMGQNNGGFVSDVVRIPFAEAMLVPIPDGIDPATVASLSDNIPDAWRTVGPPLAERPGAAVMIAAGGASIALYATGLALALGASRVDLVGGTPWLRATAHQIGANLLDPEFPAQTGRYPVTVDASNNVDGLACALRSTEPEGLCTSIGIYFQPLTPVPLLDMFVNGIRFHTGRAHARAGMDPALDLVATGRFHPDLITGHTASWDQAPEAILDHRRKLIITRERGPR